MPKYLVINPWHGVKEGQTVELEKLHPAIAPNVRELPDEPAKVAKDGASTRTSK